MANRSDGPAEDLQASSRGRPVRGVLDGGEGDLVAAAQLPHLGDAAGVGEPGGIEGEAGALVERRPGAVGEVEGVGLGDLAVEGAPVGPPSKRRHGGECETRRYSSCAIRKRVAPLPPGGGAC